MVFRTQRVDLQLVMQNWPQLCPWFFRYILGRNHRIAPWTCTTTFENSNFSYFWCFVLFFDEFVRNYVCKIIPPIAPAKSIYQKMTTSSRLSNRSDALPTSYQKIRTKLCPLQTIQTNILRLLWSTSSLWNDGCPHPQISSNIPLLHLVALRVCSWRRRTKKETLFSKKFANLTPTAPKKKP